MQDTSQAPTTAGPASSGTGGRWLRRVTPYLGIVPFVLFVTIFLLWPTYLVVTGAFRAEDGSLSTATIVEVLTSETHLSAFRRSVQVSVITAVAGAVLGGLMAWAISIGRSNGPLRRVALAASGVFAQFGGVMLAFAFLATFGFNGMVTLFLTERLGETFLTDASWLYGIGGLAVVYTFFQIPLMLIVFLPAMENVRPEWREASDGLGGSTWEYWRHVAGPILFPSFIGATLLLFANAFSAYATAAALISQGSPIVPLQIRGALSSETTLSNQALGSTLALGMVVVVAIVMTGYALLQRRVAKWSQ